MLVEKQEANMDGLTPSTAFTGRLQPIIWTVMGPLVCSAIAVGVNHWMFSGMDREAYDLSLKSALILPIFLGVPVFFFFSLKMRELSVANNRLRIMAATDGLTACLNRNAFAAQVNARVTAEQRAGALLIVDADHFKRINDRFGHQAGDAALELIADTLRTAVRAGDIVGRLGGEEFGIFLPSIDSVAAARVAERVRMAVADIAFIAGGKRHQLHVSIGGVVFDGSASFETLFSQADDRLYYAKQNGRNRTAMTRYIPAEVAS